MRSHTKFKTTGTIISSGGGGGWGGMNSNNRVKPKQVEVGLSCGRLGF